MKLWMGIQMHTLNALCKNCKNLYLLRPNKNFQVGFSPHNSSPFCSYDVISKEDDFYAFPFKNWIAYCNLSSPMPCGCNKLRLECFPLLNIFKSRSQFFCSLKYVSKHTPKVLRKEASVHVSGKAGITPSLALFLAILAYTDMLKTNLLCLCKKTGTKTGAGTCASANP